MKILSSVVIFKRSSVLNLWTRTILWVLKTLSLDEQGINYWGDFINTWTRGYKCYKPWIK